MKECCKKQIHDVSAYYSKEHESLKARVVELEAQEGALLDFLIDCPCWCRTEINKTGWDSSAGHLKRCERHPDKWIGKKINVILEKRKAWWQTNESE